MRFSHMKELEEERREICDRYLCELKNDSICLPKIREGATHIWHQFVIKTEKREELIKFLDEKG